MNYIVMLLRKNKNIIPIIGMYISLYIVLIFYMLNIDSNNIYYILTLDKYIFYIFHGFFFILTNYTIINNALKKEAVVRIGRNNCAFILLNTGIFYSVFFSLISNSILLFILNIEGIQIELTKALYTILYMTLYCTLLYSIITIIYIKKQIVSIIIANIINILPIIVNIVFSNLLIYKFINIDIYYSNIYSSFIVISILIIINSTVSYIEFRKCDYII